MLSVTGILHPSFSSMFWIVEIAVACPHWRNHATVVCRGLARRKVFPSSAHAAA